MRMKSITMEPLEIPFKMAFEHASAVRSKTQAVVVRVTAQNGVQGIGEGCPREYVTGESIQSALGFFDRHRENLLSVSKLTELRLWIEDNVEDIEQNPSAFCAVELALLDALAKSQNKTVEGLLDLPELSGVFKYTGVLGARSSKIFNGLLKQYSALGIRDYKVKLFGNCDVDRINLSHISQLKNEETRIRFDANNRWTSFDEATSYMEQLDCPLFAIEEPLQVGDFEGMRRVFDALNAPIILDESFRTLDDFNEIQQDPHPWIVNIRISKMGGLIRSLEVASQAREAGIPIIVGAQVGETSILTRSAMTVANAFRGILVAQEGAFGTYLLEYDLLDPPIMFGLGGEVRVGPDTRPLR